MSTVLRPYALHPYALRPCVVHPCVVHLCVVHLCVVHPCVTASPTRAQRERVQQYVVKAAEMAKLKEEIKALEGALDTVDDARRALREELDIAWNIRQKYLEEERGVREVMDGIAAERQSVRELRYGACGGGAGGIV